MSNTFEYKGYHTRIEFDAQELVLRGKIEGINDLVNFEGESIKTIEEEFRNAVDDYLEFCEEVGKEPDKEYKGTFNVRISPKLHKDLAVMAFKNGDSLNTTVEKAIIEYVSAEENEKRYLRRIKILAKELNTESTYLYNGTQKYLNDNIIQFYDRKIKFN